MNETATYDFLSGVRRGAASEIAGQDPLTGSVPYRAKLGVELRVALPATAAPGSRRRDREHPLDGPGDVLGIDPRHIIRSDPKDGRADLRAQLLRHSGVLPSGLPLAVLRCGAQGGGHPAVGCAAVAGSRRTRR